VNGTVVRIVSGTDIRITGGGRIEIINAIDAKFVLGPNITVVGGPKLVFAPLIIHLASNYTIHTTDYIVNANVVIYNTPQQTIQTQDHSHWRWTRWEIEWTKGDTHGLAFDVYGFKLQVCRYFWSANGFFTNLAARTQIQYMSKYTIGFVELKQFIKENRSGGLRALKSAIFVKMN